MAGEATAAGATAGTLISPGLGTVIGAGTGLVSDVIGGLLGSSSNKKESSRNRKEARRQFDAQMDFQKNATQYRVQDALKAGINPLAALGVSSNVSPTVSTGYGSGDQSWSNVAHRTGDRLQNMIERLTAEKAFDDIKYNREAQALDLESRRLQNEHFRLQNQMLGQPGVPEPEGTDAFLWRPVEDLNGDIRLMVNQDVTENDSDNASYLATIAKAVRDGFVNPVSGEIKSPQYKMFLEDQYYRATGRHLNIGRPWYISSIEAAIAGGQGYRSIRGG